MKFDTKSGQIKREDIEKVLLPNAGKTLNLWKWWFG
jgi:hypothetical protein